MENNEPQDPKTDSTEPKGSEPKIDDAAYWKSRAREWENKSKSNAEKAKAYDELQEKSKTDLQKAQEEAEKYKKQFDELSTKTQLDAARSKIAKETGIPTELIHGANEEEMKANAEAIAKFAKPNPAPKTPNAGKFANNAGEDKDAAKRELAKQIFGSEN